VQLRIAGLSAWPAAAETVRQVTAATAILSRKYFMFRIPFLLLMSGDMPNRRRSLLQITEIGRHGVDLRPGQAVRNRRHDERRIRFCRVLTPLFAPVRQFLDEVGIELTG